MEPSLIYLYLAFLLSVFLLAVAGIIIAAFVIPLQYREARVRNGLASLRKQMLLKGILALIVIIVVIFCLVGRFIIPDVNLLRILIATAVLVFSAGILGKGMIDYQIYHQQYSEKNKELHERIEKIEIADAKRARIDKRRKK